MSRRWDVAVVGGGPDALACAALLARAGRTVVLVEPRPVVGGAWVTEEIAPGFRASTVTPTASQLRPALVRALDLDRQGLTLVPLRSSWAPSPEGPGVCRWADPTRTREEMARIDMKDADRYPELVRTVARLAPAAARFAEGRPIDPGSLRPREIVRLGSLAYGLLRGGDLLPLLGVATQSIADWLAEWFESEVIRAPLVAIGLQGAFLGPRSPGTALRLLLESRGGLDPSEGGRCIAIGGNGAVSDAIARSARAAGVELRTNTTVERVRTEGDQATGIVLQGGEEIDAPVVVVAAGEQDGVSARIHLALDHLPMFSGRAGTEHLAGDITIAPMITAMDDAYVDARAGRWSRRPALHVTIPTLSDPTLAPQGRHVMTIDARYAPYGLAGGAAQWADERDTFADHVLSVVEELCPGLTKAVVQRQVLTPLDLERVYGMAVSRAEPPAVSGLWNCPPGGGLQCAEQLLAAGAA